MLVVIIKKHFNSFIFSTTTTVLSASGERKAIYLNLCLVLLSGQMAKSLTRTLYVITNNIIPLTIYVLIYLVYCH